MNGILFLRNEDFQLKQGDQGLLLSLNIDYKGLVLILFYSKECPHCDNLINKFKQLPNLLNGCLFAMVNINMNMSIVERSQNTVAPITFVPDVILYVNGNPYIRYDGAHDIEAIKTFLHEVYQKIQKTAFVSNTNNNTPVPDQSNEEAPKSCEQIPAYTIGKPISGDWKKDTVCYLDFRKAYVTTQ